MLSIPPVNLHEGQHVLRGGAPAGKARVGAPGVALVAPQAAGNAWYPQRFLVPLDLNEPYLGSALGVMGGLVGELVRGGVPLERIVLIGFSQGACLSLEFASRNPRRYGGVMGLSGALIGPPGAVRGLERGLDGTPVYLGCSDRDAHIPLASVEESAVALAKQGANVTKSIFKGMGHTVNGEELAVVQLLVRQLAGAL
jgi:predicted esterase